MADIYWRGGAKATAQVNTFAFAGTWEATDLIRVTIGAKTVDFTAGSTTTATVVSSLVTAWLALDEDDYPEFAEITPSASTTTLTLTAATAGVPFTATLTPLESNAGTADDQTIEGGTSATTGTAATASAGPSHWDTAANWSGGAVPTTSDNVYFEHNDSDVKYGLAQSSVTLAILDVRASFTGTIGLPDVNEDAAEYPEYRARELAISATSLVVGEGDGGGSGRVKVNVGSNACTLTVRGTGSPLDGERGALQWRGTHASNVVNAYSGDVDVAETAGHTATVATLRVGQDDGSGQVAVRCGAGVSLTTVAQTAGALTLRAAATTVTMHGGALALYGAATVSTLTNNAGSVDYRSSGTVTTYNGGPSGSIDFSRDLRARTLTNCTLLPGSSLSDPGGTVTFSNGVILSRCQIGDVSLNVGYNRTLGVT